MHGLSSHFFQYFDVRVAQTPEDYARVWRLRYDVYCEELAYESASQFPDRLERDLFDGRSVHCLLEHRDSGRTAGTFRLIQNLPGLQEELPFERASRAVWDQSDWRPDRLPRERFAELSRLAVHGHFRRRSGEQGTPVAIADAPAETNDQRSYPLIAMGLFLSSSALAMSLGLERVYVMMEPRLARLLRSCGIRFVQFGEIIPYHGQRGPFVIDRPGLLAGLNADTRAFLDALAKRLDERG